MLFELAMCPAVVAADGRLLECAVYSLDLVIRPGMVWLC